MRNRDRLFLALVVLSGLAFVRTFEVLVSHVLISLWTYHLVRAVVSWRTQPDARSFRNALTAMMIWLGCLTLYVGALAVYQLHSEAGVEVARALGFVTRGAMLVVGVFAVLTWQRR